MADYVLIYDTSTGRLLTKLAQTVHIEDGAITSAKLASGQVGSLHVAPAAIVSALIASGQLGTDHFALGQIVSAYIGAGEIGGGLVKDGGILSGKYGAGSIRTADIGDAQIVSAKIASGQVGSLHVAPAAIVSALLASGQVGSLHVAPAAIVSALIASGQLGSLHIAPNAIVSGLVASGGLAPITSGKIWVGRTGNRAVEEDKPAAGVPSGVIAIWHGTIANIPSGWVICDGNNSTPNLLTKFVEGVATAATDPGATGGATAKTTAGHQHQLPFSFYTGTGTEPYWHSTPTYGQGGAITTNTRATPVARTDENFNAALDQSKTDSIADIRPLFYDVAFIMKT